MGIVSVYKATKVVNFAHGYLIMFGAYFYFNLCRDHSWTRLGTRLASLLEARLDGGNARRIEHVFPARRCFLIGSANVPRIICGLIGAVVCNAILGRVVERTLMRPLMGQSVFAMIMVTVGLISILSGSALADMDSRCGLCAPYRPKHTDPV